MIIQLPLVSDTWRSTDIWPEAVSQWVRQANAMIADAALDFADGWGEAVAVNLVHQAETVWLAAQDCPAAVQETSLWVRYRALRRLDDHQRYDGVTVVGERLLSDVVERLGADAALVLQVRMLVADAHESVGDYAAAIEHYQLAEGEARRLHGPQHPETFTVRGNLGYTLTKAGRQVEAAACLIGAFQQAIHVLGLEHEGTRQLYANLRAAGVEVESGPDWRTRQW